MRYLCFLWLLSLLSNAAQAANADTPRSETLPTAALLGQLADVVLPSLYTALTERAANLHQAARQACPMLTPTALQRVRQAWRETARAWAAVEVFQIGPVIARRTARQIDGWPLRTTLLQPLLAAGPLDADRIDRTGSAGKGFPAIEYLLFPEQLNERQAARHLQGRPCQVLVALAEGVKREAEGLQQDWCQPDGGFAAQLREAGKRPDGAFASDAQALGDIVNLLIAGVDYVRVRKLEKPLDNSSEEVTLDRVEAWRSGESTRLIEANLTGFAHVFFGHGLPGIGVDDYLLGIAKPTLVQRVQERLQKAQAAVAAIGMPIDQALAAAPERIKAARDALRQLQRLLETELADALQVELSFNANDGD